MLKKIAATAATLLCAFAAAVPAPAATITFTMSGNYSGVRDGSAFTSDVTLVGIGDTDFAYEAAFGVSAVPLSSLTVVLDGLSARVLAPAEFFVNQPAASAGLAVPNASSPLVAFHAPELAAFNALDSLPVIVGQLDRTDLLLQTDLGALTLSATGAEVRFSAALAGVPEPATWALMIGGIGVVGGIARRRTGDRPSLI